ncbi:gfo/Idh/MocA family oxidoreductase [Romboutsia weinsteinii]|uniref:Gfo/Idh/MocA family oxidoreductase n=1 Tax=Romboutsia weinsteinii TaxID=2020949 RepID=A0A371IY24_9FIRM|nr:Gfo/Idh/MocA family oxidoreductase [Romboutsia weinsteinii]RDY25387.1 gfo/Idh/MocA family oxidoreductase [Romboutsia weinsteinii]
MGDKIRFGIIGTSKIVETFLKGAEIVDEFELVGVYSRSLEKAKSFGEKYGAKLYFDKLEDFAASNEIDAVYIASPNAMHAKQAILCLNNKHVLCEKAFASNAREVKSIIDAAKKNNVVVMEAMRLTCLPNFKAVKENLHKIGKVRRYFGSFCQYSSRYDKFKEGTILNAFKNELSNGSLMDIGVYCIYPMVSLFGKPNNVVSNSYMLHTNVDGEGSAIFSYDDMDGVIQYSKISNSYLPSEIQGEKGSIIIYPHNKFKNIKIVYKDLSEEDITLNQEEDDMCYEISEFIKTIKSNSIESEVNNHNNSIVVMELMDEIRKQAGLKYPADEN